jgi:predicted CXXCH cytochrome family protein
MSFSVTRYTYIKGTEETQTQEIEGTKIHLGRGTGSDVQLDDLRVSLHHASIEQVGEAYILKDLDSANGTYVNRRAINEHRLVDSDEIQVGPYTLHVRIGAPDAPVVLVITSTEHAHTSDTDVEVSYLTKYALAKGFITKKRLTTVGLVLVVGGLFTVIALGKTASGKRAYSVLSPGKVSTAHRLFEDTCVNCHTDAWQSVADTACTTCHSGPVHHENQQFTPPCASCHQEHRSRQKMLTAMGDQHCTQCHANLGTTHGTTSQFAASVKGFTTNHPEFAVQVGTPPAVQRVRLTEQPKDSAAIKLNHEVHLKPHKIGARGFVQLQCDSCHQMDAPGAYMRPITFEKHCAECHSLAFDPRFPQLAVPHAEPKTIHTFLVNTFTQYVLQHVEECEARVQKPIRQRPGQPPTPEEAQSMQQCVDGEVRGAERFLFDDKVCKECHSLTRVADNQLPVVTPPAVPERWFAQSVFNHEVHARAGQSCADCHRGVQTSQRTSDVLLPGIAVCQECHTTPTGARSECVTCHVYHDKTKARETEARLHRKALFQHMPGVAVESAPQSSQLKTP